jgi:hypothetical protein
MLFLFWAGSVDKAWYSVRYLVVPDHVKIEPKPSDCDFMQAPLGRKGCHYQAKVNAMNAQGVTIDGDYAPEFSHDTSGQVIVSRKITD